jgi:uncharacterized membrane protein
MWAGLPISLLADGEYRRRASSIHDAYATTDAVRAWRIFRDAHVRFVYLDTVERAAFSADACAKFDRATDRFHRVFANDEVVIYEVRP